MKTTFIYALKELAPGEFFSTKIRYIGKANDPYGRFQKHCVCQRKDYRGNWIRSLPPKGLSLQLEILDEVPDLEWKFWEKEYIRVFRAIGFDLTNTTEGGDGIINPSDSVRAKQRAAKLGKKHTLAQREARSKRMLENPPNRGRKFPEQARRNMSLSHLGKRHPHTKEWNENIGRTRANKKAPNNTSGFAGISRFKRDKKWTAFVRVASKRIYLGAFEKLEDAVFVRALAMDKYFS